MAMDLALSGLDAEQLRSALLAEEALSEQIRHIRLLLELHRLAMTLKLAVASLGYNKF
jgi:hypothetical protein